MDRALYASAAAGLTASIKKRTPAVAASVVWVWNDAGEHRPVPSPQFYVVHFSRLRCVCERSVGMVVIGTGSV